jgi:formamidopyrimidine-DNA glycosylase
MLDNGYGILFWTWSGGMCGKILFHRSVPPEKYNIIFNFTDGSCLTYTVGLTSMGICELSHEGWQNRVKGNQKFDPLGNHSFNDYINFINGRPDEETKKPIKIFLATNILGVISTLAAEILLFAKQNPSVQLRKLSEEQHKKIYESMKFVFITASEKGGGVNEFDLYGQKGKYIVTAERKHIGENCPVCGDVLGKTSVGGVTAFCPNCQTK